MKKHTNFLILLVLVLTIFWPSTVYARELFEDKVVFGGTYTLESGETLDGNLVIFGGAVTTEPDSTVNGDVALLGGVAEIGGSVNGNVIGIGGAVQVTSTAEVNGDLVTIGATLSRDEGARVSGQIVNGIGIPFTFNIPNSSGQIPDIPDIPDFQEDPIAPIIPVVPQISQIPGINLSFNPILDMMWFFFRTFMFAMLAVLVVIFFDKSTDRVAKAAIDQPLITAGAGLLTAILAPFVLVAMTITIILIPVTLVTILILVVAWLFGWIAVGLEVGRRIAKLFNAEWAPAVSAGIGTFLLFFVLGGFSELIICIGWIPQVLVGLWGLGAVIMTRFGSQEYVTNGSSSDSITTTNGDITGENPPQIETINEPEILNGKVVEEDTELEDLS